MVNDPKDAKGVAIKKGDAVLVWTHNGWIDAVYEGYSYDDGDSPEYPMIKHQISRPCRYATYQGRVIKK